MPDLTKEEKAAKLANLEKAGKLYLDEAAALRTELGLPAPNGGSGESKEVTGDEVDQLADRFWKMSQKERHDHLLDHPDEHKRLLEAVERQGTRKLMKLDRP